jgi:hypothetical protein
MRPARLLAFLLAPVLVMVAPTPVSEAQIPEGATMTVLRGQVAVVQPSRDSLKPAPSGTVVRVGSEVHTLDESGALVTFFAGTEIELGENTALVVERVSQDGGRVDISLKHVFGASLHRVHALSDPGSSYRVDVGGAVAVVRGTEFLVYGPTDESVVGIVCLDDCTDRTSFAGCPMAPNLGYWVEVDRGKVVSACQPFSAGGDPWGAPAQLRLRNR